MAAPIRHHAAPPRGLGRAAWAVPLLAGAAVAVALGVYGRVHEPTYEPIVDFGFSDMLPMKAWLTTAALGFGLVQVVTAAGLYGKLPPLRAVPPWVHRWSGRAAFILTVPVAFHCLYALGLDSSSTRALAHGLVGCLFYGAFVTKMLLLERGGVRPWALPLAGGVVFVALVELWLTSSLWFFTTIGVRF